MNYFMNEQGVSLEVAKMCVGCGRQEKDGSCNLREVDAKLQQLRALQGLCSDAMVYDSRLRFFFVNMIRAVEGGSWAIYAKQK